MLYVSLAASAMRSVALAMYEALGPGFDLQAANPLKCVPLLLVNRAIG